MCCLIGNSPNTEETTISCSETPLVSGNFFPESVRKHPEMVK